ncbi:hypothetical protein ACWDE9_01680 [Streptomyces olivaceoviridis]|uniref:hypothetical protein n=1 Tax=Streptomyces olivaceoviridis TaxID=1921 RepID=UPI001677A54F|nr:hypothetical protein [Streptomyces olivaceoviridis]GGZ01037.1 hypothetical protein GCM10010300_51230 [Streptomyces olivaceoviridis]
MADDNVFVADPSRIQSGAGATDQVAEATDRAAEQFAEDTAFDPADPPWGNDSYGKQYVQNYVPFHNLLRDGIRDLAQAMEGAARLTLSSGKNFEKTQTDNTKAIHDLPTPHTHI